MNKKGFTLVELLAIIIIIAVVMIIAAPNMTRQIQKSEEENQSVLNRKIENASKLYAAKYYVDKLVTCSTSDCNITFSLDDLEKDGLLDLNGKCDLDEEINITYDGEIIDYDYGNISCYEQ